MRSPNDEGSQFTKLHFLCNKEERLVLKPFFREYNLYLKKTLNLFKVAYHPVSCFLHLHIIKASKNSQQNNLETITNENDKEIPKERYMSPEKRQETIDDLRLK